MNTERLIEFQVLAQTLHYGAAASRLYISPSVLSRHIQDLENELGIQLFIRSSHSVSLTEAGIAFYRMSKDFADSVWKGAKAARIAGMNLKDTVRIALFLPTMSDRIRNFILWFEEQYPDIRLLVDIATNSEGFGVADYNYITLPSLSVSFPDCFVLENKSYETAYVAYPIDMFPPSKKSISLKELKDMDLFLPGLNLQMDSYTRIGQRVRQATENHIHIIPVTNTETAILNVELKRGITVIPKHRRASLSNHVRSVEISDECGFNTFLMKNKFLDSPAVKLFGEEFAKIL